MNRIAFFVCMILGAHNLFADDIEELITLPSLPRYESKFLTQVNLEAPPSGLEQVIEAAAMVSAMSAMMIAEDSSERGKKKTLRDERKNSSMDLLMRHRNQLRLETH